MSKVKSKPNFTSLSGRTLSIGRRIYNFISAKVLIYKQIMTTTAESGIIKSSEHPATVNTTEPIFRDISADDPNPETTNIESACMNCFQSGYTRLLMTKIPFFKEIVIMSFKCEHCGFENNEIQSVSEIQEKGCRIVLNVSTAQDLNRRIVRSDYTKLNIPEVQLEIPTQSQKADITTVEGILDRAIRGLSQDQDKRRIEHPDEAQTIDTYIEKLVELKEMRKSFTLILEDISGNSFIENPNAPAHDDNCKQTSFSRTKEQDNILGLYASEDIPKNETTSEQSSKRNNFLEPIEEGAWSLEDLHGEVLQFQTICSSCRAPCETNMKLTNIPHFKDVVIMATICDVCGVKTNEVKSGGGIEDKGVKFEILIDSKEDFSRDVLKSDTCSLRIPELDCEVGPAALGGRFTTIEGILVAMKEQLEGDCMIFQDSSDEATKQRISTFIAKFENLIKLKTSATLILDDPAGNSYVQSLCDDETDPKLKITRYERNYEQNEELGLNDIKTENY